ncbi:hypothetical protein PTKIN_Ptkin10aG0139300 [Pterospermum kingtungense]
MQEHVEQASERFSKRLTQKDVEKRTITIPFSEVAGIFDFEEGRLFCLDVLECTGQAWTFLGAFHRNEEMGSVVSISSPQFVSEKALKANDEVVFVRQSRENDSVPWKKFKIEVRRKIRLFGQDIWGDLRV